MIKDVSRLVVGMCEASDILTLAEAILDRIVHNAYKLELKGDSQRRKKALDLP
jgi:DNA replication protein DnaC